MSDGSGFGKNVIIFGADISLSVHIDNKYKDKGKDKGLGKVPIDNLDDTTLTAKKEHSIKFTEQQKKICLSLHYNGVNSFTLTNNVKIYTSKIYTLNAIYILKQMQLH